MPKSFKGYDDWSPAHTAAKWRAVEAHGLCWALVPGAFVRCRVPASWVACRVYGRTSRSPRDIRMPAAHFWPDGRLPIGPEYERAAPFTLTPTEEADAVREYPNEPAPQWRAYLAAD